MLTEWGEVGSNSLVKGPLGIKFFLMTKSKCFLFSIVIFRDLVSYFLGMVMLIRLLGTMAQTKVKVGRLHTLVRGP